MLKHKFFFWLERLKISRGERYAITVLIVILISLFFINFLIEPNSPFNRPDYTRIERFFKKRTAILKRKHAKVMAAYKGVPASAYKLDTIPVVDENFTNPININTASVQRLKKLPGIGRVYAQNIIDYRKVNGPFTSKEELLEVSGIGEARFNKLKSLIIIGEISSQKELTSNSQSETAKAAIAVTHSNKKRADAPRININRADAKKLNNLPGIGPAYAQNIIDYRNANGSFVLKKELLNVSGIGDVRFQKIKPLIILGAKASKSRATSVPKDTLTQTETVIPSKNNETNEIKRINVNTAKAKKLITLPGIGDAYAQNIIQYRQESGSFTTFKELLKVNGIGKKRLAKLKPFIKLTGDGK